MTTRSLSSTCGNCRWWKLIVPEWILPGGKLGRCDNVEAIAELTEMVKRPFNISADFTCPHHEPKQEPK